MRYFIGLLVALGLIIILIILLLTGGKKAVPTQQPKTLTDYASTDSQVSMTIDGPVNADSEHDQVRVSVDSANVTYEHIRGYQGDVVQTKVFENNQDAYDVFLHALLHAGYSLGSNDPQFRDERGYCSTGDRYIFELTEGDKTITRYWSSSCGSPKTYEGNTGLTITLFQAQVPSYETLTGSIQNL